MPSLYQENSEPIKGYRLIKFLGRGGFGEVWKAEGPGRVLCALKIINLTGNEGQSELRSITRMKGISHIYLVPIFGVWLKDNNGGVLDDVDASGPDLSRAAELIIAMGLGDGTLATVLKECKKQGQQGIPPERLLRYMEQTAEALDFLNEPQHDLGSGLRAIHHCDIKPANILTKGQTGAWVCDFGVARFRKPEADQSRTGMELGFTAAFAPPELMLDGGKPNHTSDQYSLAITYYELRTGKLPFEPDVIGPMAQAMAHMEGKLVFDRVDEAEREVLRKATARSAPGRYATASAMVSALRVAVLGVEPTSTRPQTWPRVWPLREGQEVGKGFRLLKLLNLDEQAPVWEAETSNGESWCLQLTRGLPDPSPACRALEQLKGKELPGMVRVLSYWLLDKRGCVVVPTSTAAAETLVIGTRPNRAGRSLLDCLLERKQAGQVGLPRPELLSYLSQVADTLDRLNGGGMGLPIQHGDVRPENLLVPPGEGATLAVVLAQFGSARVMDGDRALVARLAGEGEASPYWPPEAFEGALTKFSDQYALAVTYCHLRTGKLPLAKASTSAVQKIADIRHGRLVLDDLPGPEREVIEQATHPNAWKRFASCKDLLEALGRCPELQLRTSPPTRAVDLSPAPPLPAIHVQNTSGAPKTAPWGPATPVPEPKPRAKQVLAPSLDDDGDWAPLPQNPTLSPSGQEDTANKPPAPVMQGGIWQLPNRAPAVEERATQPTRSNWPVWAVAGSVTAIVLGLVFSTLVLPLIRNSPDIVERPPDTGKPDPPVPVPPPIIKPAKEKGDENNGKTGQPPVKPPVDDHKLAEEHLKNALKLIADRQFVDASKELALAKGLEQDELVQLLTRLLVKAEAVEKKDCSAADVQGLIDALANAKELGEDQRKAFEALVAAETKAVARRAADQAAKDIGALTPASGAVGIANALKTLDEAAGQLQAVKDDIYFKVIRKHLELALCVTAATKAEDFEKARDKFTDAIADDKVANKLKRQEAEPFENLNNQFAKRLQSLYADEVRDEVPGLSGNEKWIAALKKCAKAQKTAWVLACQAECIVELRKASRDLDRALTDLEPEKGNIDSVSGYVAYASALLQHALAASDEPKKRIRYAANHLLNVKLPAEFVNAHRATKAQEILLMASKDLRNDKLIPPYTPDNAKLAAPWLQLAATLLAVPGTPAADSEGARAIRLHLALAEGSKEKPDKAVVVGLTKDLCEPKTLESLEPTNRFAVLHVYALAQEENQDGRKARLDAYLRALELGRTKANGIAPAMVYEAVIGPARQLPKQLYQEGDKVEQASVLASLYAEAAVAIKADANGWAAVKELGDAKQAVIELYGKAAEKEPNKTKKADYIVQGGYEKSLLSPLPLEEVRKAAADAVDMAPDYAQGHTLKGIVFTLESRPLSRYAEKIALLKEAEKSFREADRLFANAKPADKAMLNRARANVSVELGNYDQADEAVHFRAALGYAEEVFKDRQREPDYEDWRTLGNAREDVAWKVLPINEKAAAMKETVAAFTEMEKAVSGQAAPLMSRGRVRVKWAEALANARGRPIDWEALLKDAEADFADAMVRPGSPVEMAEIHFWRARACRLVRVGSPPQFDRADQEYNLALAAVKGKNPAWEHQVLWDHATMLVDVGRNQPEGPQIDKALELAEQLKTHSAAQAAWVEGRCYSARGKRQNAWEAYGSGLPKDKPAEQDRDTVALLLMGQAEVRAYQSPLTASQLRQAAEDAEKAYDSVKDAGLDKLSLATVAYCKGVLVKRMRTELQDLSAETKEKYRLTALKWLRKAFDDDPEGKASAAFSVRHQIAELLALQEAKRDGGTAEGREEALKMLDRAKSVAEGTLKGEDRTKALKSVEFLRSSIQSN